MKFFLPFFNSRKKKAANNQNDNNLIKLNNHSDLLATTNIGVDRQINEDFTDSGTNQYNDKIIFVCDGLGGYKGGKKASEILGKKIIQNFLKIDFKNEQTAKIKEWFVNTVNEAKFEINRYVNDHPDCNKMASTLVMAIITNKKIFGFSIGDSRLYGIKNHKIYQISKDDNFLNYLLDQKFSEEEIHAYGNQIYAIVNYVGQFDETQLKYNFFEYQKEGFDWLFVTSDGVHNFIHPDDLKSLILSGEPLDVISENIINRSLSGMSNDNLSIAIARI